MDVEPISVTHYRKSKLEAEETLIFMNGVGFAVILRSLIVYGGKGDYRPLEKWGRFVLALPDYRSKRSLMSIKTICTYTKDAIA